MQYFKEGGTNKNQNIATQKMLQSVKIKYIQFPDLAIKQ